MDSSQLPIHERLDALLNRLDNSDSESENEHENVDYEQFVERRAVNDLVSKPLDDNETAKEAVPEETFSDLEFSSDLSDADAYSDAEPKKDEHEEIIRSIYEEAGLEDTSAAAINTKANSSKPETPRKVARKPTEKQVEREREEAARNNLRLERELVPEVGEHTVKTFTVKDFLAELDAVKEEEPKPVLLSSPPRQQPPLTDFIASSDHVVDLSDDDGLEIVPDTKVTKMSRAARDMLKFAGDKAGGTTNYRKLALEREKLQSLEIQQTRERQQKNKELLKAQGLDVDAINEEISTKQRDNAGGAEVWLANERKNAEKLREVEASDASDEEDEFDVVRKKKMLSDDDDDDEADDEADNEADNETEEADKEAKKSNKNIDKESDKDYGTTDDSHEFIRVQRIYETTAGTQYLPPVSSNVLAEIMELDRAGHEQTVRDDPGEEIVSSDDENMEIVRSDEIVPQETVLPDLTGLNRLPAEERLAVVRQRYLEAKAAERRKQQRAPVKSNFIEDQAEESDEENSHNRDDDEDDPDDNNAELEEIIERRKVKVSETELRRQFLEDEKVRDQKLLNKFVDGVHGGFRRRRERARMGEQFLSDDELGFSDDELNHRLLIESKRKSSLLNSNQQVAHLAKNERAAAFFTSISEDLVSRPEEKRTSVQESLEFLHSIDLQDHRKESLSDLTDLHDDADAPAYEPTRTLSVSRPKTVLDRSQSIVKGSTYASRVSSADRTASRGPEVTVSLRNHRVKKPKARFVAPPTNLPQPKRRPTLKPTGW